MKQRKLFTLLFLLLVVIGTVRVVLTYRHVAQTVDETPNIACGMEWMDKGTYLLGPFHPPLARAAIAVGPYLYGLRSQGGTDRWKEGNVILHSGGRYGKALTMARLGILVFFILASVSVWLWGRRLAGEWGGIAAVFVFTNTPIVLAHSGIATTDMAVAASVSFALYRLTVWLEERSIRNSVLLGVGVALALLSKFSAPVVLPVCGVCLLAALWLGGRSLPRVQMKHVAVAAVVAFVVLWAGYRFSTGYLREPVASGMADSSKFWAAVSRIPLPAPEFVDGLLLVRGLNRDGHPAYLLGEFRTHGWWYFFPVALAVKTPLAILVLALLGFVAVARRWAVAGPAFCCLMILCAALFSHLNTGLRYLLFLFPLLSIVAAQGLMWAWQWKPGRWAGAALLVWLGVSSLAAHPDYIPYFNAIAGDHPERILVDSDLDWGQDMRRLAARLQERKVQHVYVNLLWSGDDTKTGLPAWDGLEPYQRVKGWVAISYTQLKTRGLMAAAAAGRSESGYAWLEKYQPVERIGKSIVLYYIPE